MNTKLIDISRTLAADIAVWPGDDPFEMRPMMTIREGGSVNVTRLNMSAHTGTHADAPYHFNDNGRTLETLDLAIYWGPAQVVTVHKAGGALLPADFAAYDLGKAPRLLVRTPASTYPPTQFPANYPYPGAELAEFLKQQGVFLYGTDAPSMDHVDSKTLPGHQAMLRHTVAIIEGLDLQQAPDGLYELVAFPLKIKGGDGSPIRAVLRTLS
jgi:arylformamidase